MQKSNPVSNLCTHLGLHDDPLTALAYPSAWNFCYRARQPESVRLDYQAATCLTRVHVDCPLYLASEGEIPTEIRGRFKIRARRGISWRVAILVGVVLVLAILLMQSFYN